MLAIAVKWWNNTQTHWRCTSEDCRNTKKKQKQNNENSEWGWSMNSSSTTMYCAQWQQKGRIGNKKWEHVSSIFLRSWVKKLKTNGTHLKVISLFNFFPNQTREVWYLSSTSLSPISLFPISPKTNKPLLINDMN
jgi:hypothetical protein